jgi:putative membrane protein
MKRLLMAAVAATALAGPALAQEMTAEAFVTEAASSNIFEIRSSELALERSQDEAIRTFAQQMLADHHAVGQQMEALAANAGISVPQQPEGVPAQLLEQVEGAADGDFDRVYVDNQIAGHQATVELFQSYAESGSNQPLAAFAQEMLPALQQHLNLAQSLPQ